MYMYMGDKNNKKNTARARATATAGMDWSTGAKYPYAWPIYIAFNFSAMTMSVWMIGMIVTSHRARRSSANVLLVGLASSSLGLCITCGFQCVVNQHYHYFANGTWACYFMAYAHYITIIEHLHVLSLIAIRNVLAVCSDYIMSARQAWALVLLTYGISGTLVAVLGQFSPPYLQPSGTFCFFGWTSPVAVGYFIPLVVVTSMIQAVCYGKIYLYAQEVLKQATAPTVMGRKKIDTNKLQISLAKRLFVFVVVLFVCYTPALIMVIHELFIGPMFAEWDVVFAVGVLLEGLIDCVLYGLQNPELQEQFVKLLVTFFLNTCHCCQCCLSASWWIVSICFTTDPRALPLTNGAPPSSTNKGSNGVPDRTSIHLTGPEGSNGHRLSRTPSNATLVTSLLDRSPPVTGTIIGLCSAISASGSSFPWQQRQHRLSSTGSIPSAHSSRSDGGEEHNNKSCSTSPGPGPGSAQRKVTGDGSMNTGSGAGKSTASTATLVGSTSGSPSLAPPLLHLTNSMVVGTGDDVLTSARRDYTT